MERNIALGSKLGVTGTPTVFVPSGQRAPGAVSIEYLENLLAKDKLSE
ncbi:MAG: thioredoxin fold domain-containing protein [Parasutterella excrementihominis]